jgi:hypothetical protein
VMITAHPANSGAAVDINPASEVCVTTATTRQPRGKVTQRS